MPSARKERQRYEEKGREDQDICAAPSRAAQVRGLKKAAREYVIGLSVAD